MYIKVRDVAKRLGVDRSTIWRWLSEGNFPEPYRFGSSTVRWHEEELKQFEMKSSIQK
jgi:excisionase family DNA binding protein